MGATYSDTQEEVAKAVIFEGMGGNVPIWNICRGVVWVARDVPIWHTVECVPFWHIPFVISHGGDKAGTKSGLLSGGQETRAAIQSGPSVDA